MDLLQFGDRHLRIGSVTTEEGVIIANFEHTEENKEHVLAL